MAKSLSERIAERVRSKKTSVKAQNRATFLALKAEIAQAIDDGWPVKSIWETLHDEGKIAFSYQAFRNYANSLIRDGKKPATPSTDPLRSPETSQAARPDLVQQDKKKSPPKRTQQSPRVSPTPPAPTGFNFDANPKKEDYL